MRLAAIFHSAPPSPKTPRFLLPFLLSHLKDLWDGSRHTPLLFFASYNLDTFFQVTLLSLGSASSNFFNSSFFQGLFQHAFVALPMLFFFLLHSGPNILASSSSFFKICALPLHAVGYVILCKGPTLPSALLIIAPPFADASPPYFPSHPSSSCISAIRAISAQHLPILRESMFFTICRQDFSHPASVRRIHSSF